MAFQVELNYVCLVGFMPLIATRNRIAAIDIKIAETAQALGFDLVSQVTFAAGQTVQRQITLVTNELGERLWYTAAQVEALMLRLFRGALNMLIPSLVSALTPTVTVV